MITRLESIEKQPTDDGYRFKVCVKCHDEESWDVLAVLSADQIVSYRAFQKAMLKTSALMFCDDEYEQRGGAEAWTNDVKNLLVRPTQSEVGSK